MTNSQPERRLWICAFSAYAADYQRGLRHVLVAQLFVLFVNLHGQFARGQQDQSAGLGFVGSLRSISIIGMRKARVLPVPVWAVPITSLPSRAGGMARAWMGVRVIN